MDLVGHLDVMRREAERAASSRAFPKFGTIASYDPDTYRARVTVEPEGILSNWLPISSQFVGAGWGLFLGPSIGDVVLCQFADGDFQMGVIGSGMIFLPTMPTVPCPSGQAMLIHSSGTFVKLMNNGDLDLNAAGNMNVTVAGNADVTVTGDATITSPTVVIDASAGVTITSPTITLDGNLEVSGNISGGTGSGGGTASFNGNISTTGDISTGSLSSVNDHVHLYSPGSGAQTDTAGPTG